MNDHSDSQLLRDLNNKFDKMYISLFGMANGGDKGFVGETNERLGDYSKRIRWLERLAWSTGGGVGVLTWLIAHHLMMNGGK